MIGKSILSQLLPTAPVVDGIDGKRPTHVIVDDPLLVELEHLFLYGDGGPTPRGLLPTDMTVSKEFDGEAMRDTIHDAMETVLREKPVEKLKRAKRGNKFTPRWSRWS